MASRADQALIREARAGHAAAQLALARRYLAGGAGLPASVPTALYWLERAALQGCAESRRLADQARGVQPPREPGPRDRRAARPAQETAFPSPQRTRAEANRVLERAAQAGDRSAQLALGLRCAGLDSRCNRVAPRNEGIHYKRALRWLRKAAGQGAAEAWLALARIHALPDSGLRDAAEAERCLAHAALAGHGQAQLELGQRCWRTRRAVPDNDVRAVRWLMRAAEQGIDRAAATLARLAGRPGDRWWAGLPPYAGHVHRLADADVLLAARIELARRFALTRAEALLLDVPAAYRGDCLVADIVTAYGRRCRRVIPVAGEWRPLAEDIARLFAGASAVDEGNWRQRLYRLRRLRAQVP